MSPSVRDEVLSLALVVTYCTVSQHTSEPLKSLIRLYNSSLYSRTSCAWRLHPQKIRYRGIFQDMLILVINPMSCKFSFKPLQYLDNLLSFRFWFISVSAKTHRGFYIRSFVSLIPHTCTYSACILFILWRDEYGSKQPIMVLFLSDDCKYVPFSLFITKCSPSLEMNILRQGFGISDVPQTGNSLATICSKLLLEMLIGSLERTIFLGIWDY